MIFPKRYNVLLGFYMQGGMFLNIEFIQQVWPLYTSAAWLTLKLGIIGIIFSILIGLVTTMILHWQIPVLRRITKIYIEISRNTPLLIQLFFIYYGLPKIGISTNPEVCGIVGLAFLGGSYMEEAFRSSIESIPTIQEQSALSLGMTPFQSLCYVIFPQAIRIGMPAITANVIFLLKETSVFSAISLMDLMFTAKDLIGMYAKTFESLALLVFFYLLILLPISLLGSWIERRLNRD